VRRGKAKKQFFFEKKKITLRLAALKKTWGGRSPPILRSCRTSFGGLRPPGLRGQYGRIRHRNGISLVKAIVRQKPV